MLKKTLTNNLKYQESNSSKSISNKSPKLKLSSKTDFKTEIESQKKLLIEKSAIALKLRHFNSFNDLGYNTSALVSDISRIITPKDLKNDYYCNLRNIEKIIVEKSRNYHSLSKEKKLVEKLDKIEVVSNVINERNVYNENNEKNVKIVKSVKKMSKLDSSVEKNKNSLDDVNVKEVLSHKFVKLNELRQKESSDWSQFVRKTTKQFFIDKENHRLKVRKIKESLANTHLNQMAEKKEKNKLWGRNGELLDYDNYNITTENQLNQPNQPNKSNQSNQAFKSANSMDLGLNDENRKFNLREKLINLNKYQLKLNEDKKKSEAELVKEEIKNHKDLLKNIAKEINNQNTVIKEKKKKEVEYLNSVIIDAEEKRKKLEEDKNNDSILERKIDIESRSIFEKQAKYREELKRSIRNSYNFDTEKFQEKTLFMEKIKKEYEEKRLDRLEIEYLER